MSDFLYKVQSRFLFHAHIRIKIPAAFDEAVFDELFAVLERVDRLYNSYRAGSFIDRINRNAGHFVEVDDETVAILKDVMSLSDCFDGTYDVTVMPLVRLWGFYRDTVERIPSPGEIRAVKSRIDYRGIDIRDNEVRIRKGQEIVTGSFIKAYAVDQLISAMKRRGVTDGMVNAGGSTIYAINPDSRLAWDVYVSDPADERRPFHIALDNRCCSTSSQAETFVAVEGRRYGHILDPRTGYPSSNRLVCVISDNGLTGDVVSTGLFNETVDGFARSIARITEKHAVEGFLIDENGVMAMTEGFPLIRQSV